MSQYILAFKGGKEPQTEEAIAECMGKWNAWFEKIGSKIANPGKPSRGSKTVTSTGIEDTDSASPITGFTIIEAENIDQAIQCAQSNPHLEYGGTVEVAELYDIPGATCEAL